MAAAFVGLALAAPLMAVTLRDCARILTQVASVLDYLHRKGLIHGGIGPDTIVLDDHGWVRVIDAAVAPALVDLAADTDQWDLVAPRARIAPELRALRANTVGPSADQFALAVAVYACLGCPDPFEGGEPGRAKLTPIRACRDDLPSHVDAVLARALETVPGRRYPSVLEFVAALDPGHRADAPGGTPASQLTKWAERVPLPPRPEPLPPDSRPKRRTWPVVTALAFVFLSAAAWATWDHMGAIRAAQQDASEAAPRPEATREVPPANIRVAEPDEPAAPDPEPPERPSASGSKTAPAQQQPEPASAAESPPAEPETQPRRTAERVAADDAAAERTAPGQLEAPGTLFVNARPWGYVEIDGERVGHTPLAGLPIEPGTHRLRVVRDGFVPHEEVIYVSPGAQLRLVRITLPEVKP